VTSENDIVWKDIKKGCPQGSICGPTVWNFMINDLNELEENECDVDFICERCAHANRKIEQKGNRAEKDGMDEDGYYMGRKSRNESIGKEDNRNEREVCKEQREMSSYQNR